MDEPKKHICLLHLPEDEHLASVIRDRLLEAGEPVWWEKDILGGKERDLEIQKAFKASFAIVVCLSRQVESNPVSLLFERLRDATVFQKRIAPGHIFLIMVRIDDCSIPDIPLDDQRLLDDLQHVDLFPESEYDSGFERLLKSIRSAPLHPVSPSHRRYLDFLYEEHRYLQLKGFGTELRVPLELEPVYIELRALPSHAMEERRRDRDDPRHTQPGRDHMAISEALEFCQQQNYRGMVVLGDPGSGKTTLLKFLSLGLCQQASKPDNAHRFPLYLPLRHMDRFDIPLHQALNDVYVRQPIDLPQDFFSSVLDNSNCLLLLDGLDEVASTEQRQEAMDWIECQRKAHPNCFTIVTSRFAGYRGQDRFPEHFLELHVQDFSKEDVWAYVPNWYKQVETKQRGDKPQWHQEAQDQTDGLLAQLEDSSSLLELARNPLMLQIICLVHRSLGTIPKRRTKLYEQCVQVLLQKWDEAKGLEVYLDADEARRVLRPLALWMHQEENRTHADVEDVKRIIGPHLAAVKRETKDAAAAQLDRVLTSVRDRTGLFVGFDIARYGFHHLSFQEFLAAEEIVKQGHQDQLVATFGQSWWRETTLLSVGMDEPRYQSEFFNMLVRSPNCESSLDLALRCVQESLAPNVDPFRDALLDRSLPWKMRHNCALFLREIGGEPAVEVLRHGLADPNTNVSSACHDALIQLGEKVDKPIAPTFETSPQTIINAIDGSELIHIPAGEFVMGSDDGEDDERPQQTIYLDDYFISKHPVTNAQFRKFVEATGHDEAWSMGQKKRNHPNQPVTGITWHDAVAYCKWSNLRLPTEREWEKASRGTDGRKWPWGNDAPNEQNCNFGSNVDLPTEIGSYPDGASPYGCHDMAGNVWEWCVTKWRESYAEPPDDALEGDDDEPRCQRGGGFYSDANGVRCSRRDYDDAGNWDGSSGFRCAQ